MLLTLLSLTPLWYNCLEYSPTTCTPEYYNLALLNNGTSWLIHGLWIESCKECGDVCGYPTDCKISPFNITELEPLWQQLEETWFPGCHPKKNVLLSHEWTKHGTCFNGWSEFDYFNRTMAIYDQIDTGNCTGHQCNVRLDKLN